MTDPSIQATLQSSLLDALAARGVAAPALQASVGEWRLRTVMPGRSHVRHRQRAQAIFFVLKGELAVRANKQDVGRIETGALVGFASCIIRNGTYPHELTAMRPTVVAELSQDALLELRRTNEAAYDALLGLELRTLAERIDQSGERLVVSRIGTFPLLTRPPASVLGRLWHRLRARADAAPPIEPLLRGLPGLAHASEPVLRELAASFQPRSIPARQLIAAEGERESSLYLIAGGQVDVFRSAKNGASLMLSALREGALFGMVALFSGLPRNVSHVAAEEVKLYEMTQAAQAALSPEAGRVWRECLVAVLHRQLREAYKAVVAALRVFDTAGAGGMPPVSDPSLVMFVRDVQSTDDEPDAESD